MLELFPKIPAMALGTEAVRAYDRRKGHHYLWLGSLDGEPLLWRVLSKEGNQASYQDSEGEAFSGKPLFLLSEYLLGTHFPTGDIRRNFYVYFNRNPEPGWDLDRPSSVWQASDGRTWCGQFAQACLGPEERAAVLSTFKSDREYWSKRDAYNPSLPPFPAAPDILNGEQAFFLSAEEAETEEYGFPHRRSYTAESEWWTRTYEGQVSCSGSHSPEVSIVLTRFGGLLRSPASPNMKFFARPALNLDTSRVLFSSLEQAKRRTAPQGAASLMPVPRVRRRRGQTWKLTLRDRSRDGFSLGQARWEGDALVIPYQNAAAYGPSSAPNERISALITGSGAAVKYYGNIALPLSPEGEARVRLPKWSRDDRLFVFSEQHNDGGRTDYASPMREVAVP